MWIGLHILENFLVGKFNDSSTHMLWLIYKNIYMNILEKKDLCWVNPGTHLQRWLLLETGQDEGHAHGEADEGRRHDDLAQDALLVPLAVVEPFDLQGGHMLQDQPKSEMCCPCPSLE